LKQIFGDSVLVHPRDDWAGVWERFLDNR